MSGANDLIELDDGAAAKQTTTSDSDDGHIGEVEDDSSLVRRAFDQFPSGSNMNMEEGKVPIEQDRQSSGKRTAYKNRKTGLPPPKPKSALKKSRVSFDEDPPEVHHLTDEEEKYIRGSAGRLSAVKDGSAGRLSAVSKMYDVDGDGKLGMFIPPDVYKNVHILCVFSLQNIV